MVPVSSEWRTAEWGAVGLIGAAVVGALAAVIGRSRSSPAETQEQINTGFQEFMRSANGKIVQLEREVLRQKLYIQTLVKEMKKRHIPVPESPYIDTHPIELPDRRNGGKNE